MTALVTVFLVLLLNSRRTEREIRSIDNPIHGLEMRAVEAKQDVGI